MKKSNALKLTAAGLVVAVAGMAGGAMLFPVTHEVTVTKEVVKEVPGPVQIQTVEVPGPTQVKEVVVDSGKLSEVLQGIYDNDGNVSFITEDLKDTEVAQIADRFVLISDFKTLAVEAVKEQAFTELNKEVVTMKDNSTVKLYKSDGMKRLRVRDDSSDIVVDVNDYDNKDADAYVTVQFEQGDNKFEATFDVIFKDGVVDDVLVDEIHQR